MSALRFQEHCVARRSGKRNWRGTVRKSGKSERIGGRDGVIGTVVVSQIWRRSGEANYHGL